MKHDFTDPGFAAPRSVIRWMRFLGCTAVAMAVTWANHCASGAPRQPDGRQLYRQLCAKCHGRNGEGVKGKYDDALHGDWSVEKLTRVIHKTMPEDRPERCVDQSAEAVARYVHDTFYSREARERNHPARVELARLTNRQYLNAVADLLQHFTADDTTTATAGGLRATYYRSRSFRRDNKLLDRVDPVVDFDFTDTGPGGQPTGTNELSAQWRGSLMADDTGDYEILVKTPNGVRLWLNNEDEALIDGWVASGAMNEHRATIRLLAGRAYPLRLEFFRFRDKSVSISLQWKPPHGTLEPIPARNLSTTSSTPTWVVTTPFPPDDSSVGYERGVSVSKSWDEAVTQAAIEVANHVVKKLNRFARTQDNATNRVEKVEAFCEELVATAFRRPLSPEQKRLFVARHFKETLTPEDAAKRVVLLTLKSPRFLYLGLDSPRSDGFEIASRLSFALWDSLPDRGLLQRAADGELRSREQVARQARAMLNDPRARSKMRHFLHHWLQMDHAEDLSKDIQLFPGFTPEIISDLRTSLNLFLDDVVWSDSSDYRRLLLEENLFVNSRLAAFYGIETDATGDFKRVAMSPAQRSGVITHPYLLAAFSYQKTSSPIHRGVFVTRNIVGRALKPPPVAVAFNEADFSPDLSMREKVAELTRPQACQTCHSVINPLGFSLEHYDAVGRFRTQDGNRPIDAASDYVTDDGRTVRLTGARDVAEFAVGSEHARNTFIEQLFHQIVKQPMLAYGPQTLDRLRSTFTHSGFNIRNLLVEIATLSALHPAGKPASIGKDKS